MDDPAVHKWMKGKNGRDRRRQECLSKVTCRDDKQVQEMATGTYNIVPPITETSCQEGDEVSPNAENDQGFPPLTRENTQEEIRHSPKRKKKLKMEKVGENQTERSRMYNLIIGHLTLWHQD